MACVQAREDAKVVNEGQDTGRRGSRDRLRRARSWLPFLVKPARRTVLVLVLLLDLGLRAAIGLGLCAGLALVDCLYLLFLVLVSVVVVVVLVLRVLVPRAIVVPFVIGAGL